MVGVDFDNTIVSYDGLFHWVARLHQMELPCAQWTPARGESPLAICRRIAFPCQRHGLEDHPRPTHAGEPRQRGTVGEGEQHGS